MCLCVCVCVGVGNRIMNIYEVSLTILSHFNLGSSIVILFFKKRKEKERVLIFYRMRQTHNNPPIIIQLFKELQSRMLISSVIISFLKMYELLVS